ncbi:unnamed protein product [Malus baccata var. baccata]
MCLICTCSLPYSTRPFGNSLASDSIGTPKLNEFGSFGNSLTSDSIRTPKLSEFGREHS